MLFKKKTKPTPDTALSGRPEAIAPVAPHFVNGTSITPPFPEGIEIAYFGMGCFWGAEREFWRPKQSNATWKAELPVRSTENRRGNCQM